jgi:hypothetical protein
MPPETDNIISSTRNPRINGNHIMKDLMGVVPEPDAIGEFLQTHFPEKVNNVTLWLERESRSAVVIEHGRLGPSGVICDEAYVIPLTDEQFDNMATVYKNRTEAYLDTVPNQIDRSGNGQEKPADK